LLELGLGVDRLMARVEGRTGAVVSGVAVCYGALMLALPFIGDRSGSVEVPIAIWLAGSFLAGILVPRRWMLAIPIVVFAMLLGVLVLGISDSEFFSDPLSSIGLFVLAGGQIAGLLAGFITITLWRKATTWR
jgi:hypothetical protein